MKKILFTLMLALTFSICASAQSNFTYPGYYEKAQKENNRASISFSNTSDCTLTLKIIKYYGGLYTTITLRPGGSRTVYFSSTSTYKMKIKAEHAIRPSYHDGGEFSVTCNEREWTEGQISFSLSRYGNGLGPSISASEFEKNE